MAVVYIKLAIDERSHPALHRYINALPLGARATMLRFALRMALASGVMPRPEELAQIMGDESAGLPDWAVKMMAQKLSNETPQGESAGLSIAPPPAAPEPATIYPHASPEMLERMKTLNRFG